MVFAFHKKSMFALTPHNEKCSDDFSPYLAQTASFSIDEFVPHTFQAV
jgi:hypothetical protein